MTFKNTFRRRSNVKDVYIVIFIVAKRSHSVYLHIGLIPDHGKYMYIPAFEVLSLSLNNTHCLVIGNR